MTANNAFEAEFQQILMKCLLPQDAVINELKIKASQVKDKQLLKQDEVYNGALEDILLGTYISALDIKNLALNIEVRLKQCLRTKYSEFPP